MPVTLLSVSRLDFDSSTDFSASPIAACLFPASQSCLTRLFMAASSACAEALGIGRRRIAIRTRGMRQKIRRANVLTEREVRIVTSKSLKGKYQPLFQLLLFHSVMVMMSGLWP